MRILGFNITRKKSAGETPVSQLSPEALAWLAGSDPSPEGSRLANAYEQIPWVYRAINVLAEQVANVPFLFSAGDRGRENLITTGPLPDFYAHPHPQINRFQYWELRIIWLMLRGECIRIPIWESSSSSSSFSSSTSGSLSSSGGEGRGEEGFSRITHHSSGRRLKSVLILDPSRFQHIIDDTKLVGWRYTGLGPNTPLESQVFLPEEVWFEKLPNPYDFWRGLPPLMVANLATRTDFASAAFMHGLIDNNAEMGLIIRTATQLDPQQREQLMAELRKRKRRAGTADQPTIIWSGAEVVKPTLSSADLQFLENRKFTRSEICAAFGVPEEIVTATDHNKYDVMAGARLNFIENRVAPLCHRLEAEEEVTVKALDPRATGWFDLEALPIMQEALRKRLASAKLAFDMGVPFNHVNRFFDLGFPPLPWGDTGYLPTKYRPLQSPVQSSSSSSSSSPALRSLGGGGSSKADSERSEQGPFISIPQTKSPHTELPMDITSRMIPLFDGRPGLRSTIQTEVHPPGRVGVSPASDPGVPPEVIPPNTLDFLSSDATLDRYGEIISPAGWQLDTYRRNPVFQNSHQYGNIIFTLGKALITELRSSSNSNLPSPILFQRIQFAVEANPIAKIAHALYSGGFLKAVSVGFIPIRWEDGPGPSSLHPEGVAHTSPRQGRTAADALGTVGKHIGSLPSSGGEGWGEEVLTTKNFRRRYLEQELLEVSAVAIPANPNALTLALKSGALEKSDLENTMDVLRQALPAAAPSSPLSPLGPLSPLSPSVLQLLSSIRDQLKHL